MLVSFKEYSVTNEVYSIGWILSYIFTGKESIPRADDDISQIIRKCTTNEIDQRYHNVREIIVAVERLQFVPDDSAA